MTPYPIYRTVNVFQAFDSKYTLSVPTSLLGLTFTGKFKREYGTDTAHEFSVTYTDMSDSNEQKGRVEFSFDPVLTATLEQGRYVFSVTAEDSNQKILVCRGIIEIIPTVT